MVSTHVTRPFYQHNIEEFEQVFETTTKVHSEKSDMFGFWKKNQKIILFYCFKQEPNDFHRFMDFLDTLQTEHRSCWTLSLRHFFKFIPMLGEDP